jgi:hypothetical protein
LRTTEIFGMTFAHEVPYLLWPVWTDSGLIVQAILTPALAPTCRSSGIYKDQSDHQTQETPRPLGIFVPLTLLVERQLLDALSRNQEIGLASGQTGSRSA